MATSSTHRTKPKLSHDRIHRNFAVDCLSPNPKDSNWSPRDTRFILWYHLTTTLTFASIAIAHNITYPDDEQQMNDREVANIIEVVLNTRLPLIKNRLMPDGHWPRPTDPGWTPCDHEMICSKLAQQTNGRKSVMRPIECRTRSERELRGLVETLWEGTWQEILTCPRHHTIDSGTSSGNSRISSSDKENRNPYSGSPYLAPFRAATAAIANLATQSTTSSRRSPEKRSGLSPDSPSPTWTDCPRNNSSSQPNSASIISISSDHSSQARAASQSEVIIEGNETRDPAVGGWHRRTITFVGGAPAFWYILQMTALILYWALFLGPFLELDELDDFVFLWTWRQVFVRCCTLLGAQQCAGASLAAFRKALRCWWMIEVNPPEMPGLSGVRRRVGLVLAGVIAALLWKCLGLAENS